MGDDGYVHFISRFSYMSWLNFFYLIAYSRRLCSSSASRPAEAPRGSPCATARGTIQLCDGQHLAGAIVAPPTTQLRAIERHACWLA